MIERSIAAQIAPTSKKALDSTANKFADATKQQAWIRAMEQEQLTSWLRNGVIGRESMGTNNEFNSDTSFEKQPASYGTTPYTVGEKSDDIDFKNHQSEIEDALNDEQKNLTSESPINIVDAHGPEREALYSNQADSELADIDSLKMQNLGKSSEEPFFAVQSSQASIDHFEFKPVPELNSLQLNTSALMARHSINIEKFELVCRQLLASSLSDQVSLKLPSHFGQHASTNATSESTWKSTHPSQFQSTSALVDDDLEGEDGLSLRGHTANQDRMGATTQEQLRFHSEWHNEGVKIWLGVDHVNNFDVFRLVAEIKRWAVLQKFPIAEIICNGKSVVKMGSNQRDNFDLSNTEVDSKQLERDEQSVSKHFLLNKYTLA